MFLKIRNSQAFKFVPGVNWCSALQRPGVRLLHEVLGVRLVAGQIARQVVQGVDVGQRLVRQGTHAARSPSATRPQ